jgi:hypothetical protein
LENKTEATKTALWIQIVVTFGTIAVAAIAAWQAVRIAQIGKETPAPVATVTLIDTVVNTSAPTPIEKIDFDYQDSPTKHGWTLLESEADETQLVIEHISDQFVENAISISSPVKYAMEFEVGSAAAQLGKVVEFAANLDKNAAFFVYVSLERDDGSTTNGWLKLTIGKGQPAPVDQDEWRLFIQPVSTKGGDWLLYRVDLQDAVMETFGNDGWKFQQLEKFRIRGDLSLDYIHIFERQP